MPQLRARWLFLLAWGLWAAQGRFLSLFLLELGLNEAQLGMVIGVPTYCNMVLPVLWGICADRLLEWRKVLTMCALGGAFCYSLLLIPASHEFRYILPIRTFQCGLISGIMPVLDATVLRMIDHEADAVKGGSAGDAMSRRAVYGRERAAGTVGWCLTHLLLGVAFMYYPYLYMVYANISLSITFVCYIWVCDPPAFTSGAAAVVAAKARGSALARGENNGEYAVAPLPRRTSSASSTGSTGSAISMGGAASMGGANRVGDTSASASASASAATKSEHAAKSEAAELEGRPDEELEASTGDASAGGSSSSSLALASSPSLMSSPSLAPDGSLDARPVAVFVARASHWYHVAFLATIVVLSIGQAQVEALLFLFFRFDVGASNLLLGTTVVISSVFEVPLFTYGGPFLRKYGAARLMMVSLFAYSVRVFVYTVMTENTRWMVLLVEPLHGVSYTTAQLSGVLFLSCLAPEGLQNFAQGFLMAVRSFGFATGTLLGAYAMARMGNRFLYRAAFGVVLSTLAIFCAATVVHERRMASEGGINPLGRGGKLSRRPLAAINPRDASAKDKGAAGQEQEQQEHGGQQPANREAAKAEQEREYERRLVLERQQRRLDERQQQVVDNLEHHDSSSSLS